MRQAFIGLIGAVAVLWGATAIAQSAREIRRADPLVPLASEPPARIDADPPLADSLANGYVFIQYRTENLHIVPAFGPKALDDSPRIGHIHVSVDDAPWHWADASGGHSLSSASQWAHTRSSSSSSTRTMKLLTRRF